MSIDSGARKDCYKPDIAASRHPPSQGAVRNKTMRRKVEGSSKTRLPVRCWPFLPAVWSLLVASHQRIEGAMQFETEFYATGERLTVFVIESEQVIRSALHYILRDRYRTRTFAAPDEALASVLDGPDVVLLGIDILHDKGEALLAALGEHFAGAKILLVADRNCGPVAQACLERGA